jgi:hypothetical protein
MPAFEMFIVAFTVFSDVCSDYDEQPEILIRLLSMSKN